MKRRGFLGTLFAAPVVANVALEVIAEVPKKAVAVYVPPTTSLFPPSAFSAVAYIRPRVPYAYTCCNGRYLDAGPERNIDHSLDCYRRNETK
jgi:hypothetical protein